VRFESFKDQVVFDFSDVVKDDGLPYTVYTPYSRKWLGQLSSADLLSEQCSKNYVRLFQSRRSAWVLPSLEALGFSNSKIEISGPKVPTSLLTEYGKVRDLPAVKGTSRLGTHLRFGTVSIRRAAAKARELGAEVWMKELIWREFFMQILYRFPHVTTRSFRAEYDRIKWKSDEEGFQAWCEGRTGVPIVDAGMRELNATGFMHNRVRMITASYLTKHLLVDWRRGEEYFAQKLLDFDLSANNGNWQWVAGSGCDAAPYFRVFNPELQAKKFDPENQYIRTWVPEFESSTYPAPLVEHPFARERALRAYAVVKR